MRSGGLCQLKVQMTPAGIELATFRFVTQHLNHCATAVLLYLSIIQKCVEKVQDSLNSDKNNGTLHEDRYTFMIIPR